MQRREFPGVGGLGLCAARRGFAVERPLQGERIRWIVPYNVGAGFDVDVRLIEPSLERLTGAEVVVENTTGAGRLIVAPAGIDKDTKRCLDEVLGHALTDPEFLARARKARRSLDVAGSDEASADLKAGIEGGRPIRQIRTSRGGCRVHPIE